MSSPPGKIAVVQVSSGASCNASLPSTRRRKRLVNRDENREFCFFRGGDIPSAIFLIGERSRRTSASGCKPAGYTDP